MRCGVLLLQRRLFLDVPGSLSSKNSYVRTIYFWQIASGVQYNTMLGVNVGLKPWDRCGCTDDTRFRLGGAGSFTLLPWFVPLTEPPVQLREVGRDRGHLLTESCSDVHLGVCVSMSNRG